MTRFKDLSPRWITKLISPTYRQISLNHMLADHEFMVGLAKPHQAVAITTAARQYPGSIAFVNGHYVLHIPEGTQMLRNLQHLVVTFSLGDKSYYFQARSANVFRRRLELGAISARFYERRKVHCPVTLAFLDEKEVEDLKSGERVMRRFFAETEENNQVFYLARDEMISNFGETSPVRFGPEDVRMAAMQDISQGGCSLALKSLPAGQEAALMVHLQMVLKINEKLCSISCFAAIKETTRSEDNLFVRCEFFDPLPALGGRLEDGATSYTLRFGEKVTALLDGQTFTAEGVNIELPFGHHVAKIIWSDETESVEHFVLHGKSPVEINLGRGRREKVDTQAA